MATRTTEGSLDELAKGLATGTLSRGKALRWMGSAFLGAALASFPGVAWAACPTGQTRCGDRCVDLQTNERHCGSCRNRCGSNQTCCQGRCVNLKRSERHCGSCSNRCAEGQECVGGVCQGGCPSGTTPCGTGTSVTCCQTGQECVGGVCQDVCPSGTTPCGTQCCQTGTSCVNGTCCPETQVCGTQCCQTGASCVNGTCCPEAQVCGTSATLACCTVEEQCEAGVCGPVCESLLPNGESCTAASECCSGNCSNNVCCAAGRFGLSNGTCAKPCNGNGVLECELVIPNCNGGCQLDAGATSEPSQFCSAGRTDPTTFCSNDNDCPKGQFCRSAGSGDRCEVAC
jgi:Stigma-specific protein, Stig1